MRNGGRFPDRRWRSVDCVNRRSRRDPIGPDGTRHVVLASIATRSRPDSSDEFDSHLLSPHDLRAAKWPFTRPPMHVDECRPPAWTCGSAFSPSWSVPVRSWDSRGVSRAQAVRARVLDLSAVLAAVRWHCRGRRGVRSWPLVHEDPRYDRKIQARLKLPGRLEAEHSRSERLGLRIASLAFGTRRGWACARFFVDFSRDCPIRRNPMCRNESRP